MRLAYLANIRLPTEKAHGLQIMKTCEALVRQGIVVELVVPTRRNPLEGNSFSFYGVEQCFKIHRVRNIDYLALPLPKVAGFFLQSVSFYRAAKQYLGFCRADIYYTRDLIVAWLLSRSLSPVFYEIHAIPDRIGFWHKKTWGRCKGIIVISNGLKDALVKQGVSETKIMVARDAVAVDQFTRSTNRADQTRTRERLGLSLDKKIVVYTGHLYDWKGTNILAEAAKLLPDQIQVYVVGGTSEDVARLKNKYHHPNLHIVGWQSHSAMPDWHQVADVLVVPTSARSKIGGVYTSPLKLFEYMMSKRPIIASDIPSLREVLDESVATFFTADSPIALAEKIQVVLANTEEGEEKAGRAYNLVREKYSWDKRAETIKNFIFSSQPVLSI